MKNQGLTIRRGASTSSDARIAVKELHEALYNPDARLTVFFCAPSYDLDALGREIHARFGETTVIGCTTAGEITPFGYLEGSITGVSIGGDGVHASTVLIDDLGHFEFARGEAAARAALTALTERRSAPTSPPASSTSTSTSASTSSSSSASASASTSQPPSPSEMFGFLLVDGLSMQEEAIISALYRTLGTVQLFGGSAGDGTRFGRTQVYHGGRFHSDGAVFTLMSCDYPFVIFKTEHFVSTSEKMVVTKADPAMRLVTEINGEPAGREYARMVGLEVDKLTPLIFASHPVVVRVGGSTYVRSIQKVNEDESLTFFCAIDEGIVLTVAKGVDMVENLQEAFDDVHRLIGAPALVIGCDCILRYLEAGEQGFRDRIGAVMAKNNVIGFATYGEQFNAMHVNQTFTGVAIGPRSRRAA